MTVIAVVGTKGGTGKTTTAVHLAAGLSQRGQTLLIDADPQGSALAWAVTAEMTNCVAIPTPDLHRRIPELQRSWGVEHVVIDTPPGELRIIRSALSAADAAVVPLPPNLVDLNRLRATLDLIDEYPDLPAMVLFTRVDRRSRGPNSSTAIARDVLAEASPDLEVLDVDVPALRVLADAFGGPVPADLGDYAPAVEAIVGRVFDRAGSGAR